MKPDRKQEDQLIRLLALKRYEEPHPGYFDTFASKVIARIEAGDIPADTAWWQRLLRLLAVRPAVSLSFAGVAVVTLVALMQLPATDPVTAEGSMVQPVFSAVERSAPALSAIPASLAPVPQGGLPFVRPVTADTNSPPADFLFNNNGMFPKPQSGIERVIWVPPSR